VGHAELIGQHGLLHDLVTGGVESQILSSLGIVLLGVPVTLEGDPPDEFFSISLFFSVRAIAILVGDQLAFEPNHTRISGPRTSNQPNNTILRQFLQLGHPFPNLKLVRHNRVLADPVVHGAKQVHKLVVLHIPGFATHD